MDNGIVHDQKFLFSPLCSDGFLITRKFAMLGHRRKVSRERGYNRIFVGFVLDISPDEQARPCQWETAKEKITTLWQTVTDQPKRN
jgi:hypothetical protein